MTRKEMLTLVANLAGIGNATTTFILSSEENMKAYYEFMVSNSEGFGEEANNASIEVNMIDLRHDLESSCEWFETLAKNAIRHLGMNELSTALSEFLNRFNPN